MPELIENEVRIERDCSLRIVTNLSSRADIKFVAEREAKERILQRVIEIKRGGGKRYIRRIDSFVAFQTCVVLRRRRRGLEKRGKRGRRACLPLEKCSLISVRRIFPLPLIQETISSGWGARGLRAGCNAGVNPCVHPLCACIVVFSRGRNAAVGRCRTLCVSVLPAGMIHGGLIELSNIDIPVKTARVYAAMLPAPLLHYTILPPRSFQFSNFICAY